MPAGCEFICKNKDCEYTNCGVVMTGPWPLGRVELILNTMSVKKIPQLRDRLIESKNNGRKLACISYPNLDQIETMAYRIQMWSEEANCIWDFDAKVQSKEDSVDTAINNANIPLKCKTSGGQLKDFNETVKEGIKCPHCGEKMHQDRWFTNED